MPGVFAAGGLVAIASAGYNTAMDLSADDRRVLLEIARQTIRRTLGAPPGPAPDDPAKDRPALKCRAGCFVSLHTLRLHRLRGCIGRLDDREELPAAVASAASGVLEDPRFCHSPVCLSELAELSIELTLISPLRPAGHVLDFEPAQDGIYLTIDQRSGCFLPQVAQETGWSRQQLLSRLCTEKMGLAPEAWRGENARLQIFNTVLVGPEPFEA
jgi:AmmeMemoRadiSam system protein A